MSTRDRILDAALVLFNDEGVAKISTNRIAAELEISPGNLHYHFKSKEQLVEWLYRRLETELRPFTESGAALAALDDVWLALHLAFETAEKYRFFFTDIDYLVREYPGLGVRMQRMTLASMEMAHAMCINLQRSGIIRADDFEIEALAFQIALTATCWSTFIKLIGLKKAQASGPALAAYHILSLMSPYLVGEAKQYVNYLRSKYLK